MIVIARSLLLAADDRQNLSGPVLLWDNLIVPGMLEADSEAEAYPAINAANPSTAERWQSESVELQYFTVASFAQRIDAIGIARHNFGSAHIGVRLEAMIDEDQWEPVTDEFIPADDRPIMIRIPSAVYSALRLRLSPDDVAPRMAVLYAGTTLVLPVPIPAPHSPLDQSRETHIVNGTSESGEFLGRIITGQSSRTSVHLQFLPIPWYYDNMQAFVERGAAGPFFFAWLPRTRPEDVGYAWLRSDPVPSMGAIWFDVTLEIGGITR